MISQVRLRFLAGWLFFLFSKLLFLYFIILCCVGWKLNLNYLFSTRLFFYYLDHIFGGLIRINLNIFNMLPCKYLNKKIPRSQYFHAIIYCF